MTSQPDVKAEKKESVVNQAIVKDFSMSAAGRESNVLLQGPKLLMDISNVVPKEIPQTCLVQHASSNEQDESETPHVAAPIVIKEDQLDSHREIVKKEELNIDESHMALLNENIPYKGKECTKLSKEDETSGDASVQVLEKVENFSFPQIAPKFDFVILDKFNDLESRISSINIDISRLSFLQPGENDGQQGALEGIKSKNS